MPLTSWRAARNRLRGAIRMRLRSARFSAGKLFDPHASVPGRVELAGSFTDWRAIPLARDAVTNTWQVLVEGIPGNRTHRYMLLVDGFAGRRPGL